MLDTCLGSENPKKINENMDYIDLKEIKLSSLVFGLYFLWQDRRDKNVLKSK